MASPIQKIERMKIDPEVQKKQEADQLLSALLENKEAVQSLIEIVVKLQERGILDLLNALLGQGDKVLAIAVSELNKPGISDTIDHAMNLAQMLGNLEVKKLNGLIDHVNAGIDEAEKQINSGKHTTLFGLVKALKDPDVNRTITALVGFLKGAGKGKGAE
ncbi:uncharacterized protein YjgD (DUF1641 family) [Scopulibacillus daqui]|uniref:Uncharacterized protein YjgD (DUF1641 family) n=1 Tax=Scopulibacillus daqui TaxID=1469162 RepID=A0ABS2PXR5_9BACL|nr:DUF1641 domain-containing protein [Scopulibacillus daqui]MBM7644661.1 uncharacterized protein YjgD (DUF1641 family) [Scopulibacillus daqui]